MFVIVGIYPLNFYYGLKSNYTSSYLNLEFFFIANCNKFIPISLEFFIFSLSLILIGAFYFLLRFFLNYTIEVKSNHVYSHNDYI